MPSTVFSNRCSGIQTNGRMPVRGGRDLREERITRRKRLLRLGAGAKPGGVAWALV
jgi:hypothetical protein